MPKQLDDRPRVLGIRFGVNPNSSSLGVDVTYLLFGGTLAVISSIFIGSWLRVLRDKAQEHGAPPAQESP
jgi:hypothetical protein